MLNVSFRCSNLTVYVIQAILASMRGSKAKALRKLAAVTIQHGTAFQVRKSGDQQVLTAPARYLYQFLKGRNSQLGFTK